MNSPFNLWKLKKKKNHLQTKVQYNTCIHIIPSLYRVQPTQWLQLACQLYVPLWSDTSFCLALGLCTAPQHTPKTLKRDHSEHENMSFYPFLDPGGPVLHSKTTHHPFLRTF